MIIFDHTMILWSGFDFREKIRSDHDQWKIMIRSFTDHLLIILLLKIQEWGYSWCWLDFGLWNFTLSDRNLVLSPKVNCSSEPFCTIFSRLRRTEHQLLVWHSYPETDILPAIGNLSASLNFNLTFYLSASELKNHREMKMRDQFLNLIKLSI